MLLSESTVLVMGFNDTTYYFFIFYFMATVAGCPPTFIKSDNVLIVIHTHL